jgi:uncharacterized membrane protein
MTWHPVFNPWFIGLVGLFLLWRATHWVLLSSQTLPRRWLRLPVWLLRVAAIALVLAILGNPVQPSVTANSRAGALHVILVDGSDSMGLERPRSRFDRALEWSHAVADRIPEGQSSRIMSFAEEINFSGEPKLGGASTRLAGALRRVLESNPGQELANIIVVSDGRIHDREDLNGALELARLRRVPISTHVVGRDEPQRNVFVQSCRVERSAPSGSLVPVQIEIGTVGLPDGTDLEITLKDDTGKTLAVAPVKTRGATAEKKFTFPAGLRTAAYTISVTKLDGELTLRDNDFTFTLVIADPNIRVLYCEGSNDTITEMYGEMWNSCELFPTAWKRAGDIQADIFVPRGDQRVEGRTLAHVRGWKKKIDLADGLEHHVAILEGGSGLPDTREAWQSYDVIISADVQKANFTPEQLQWVVEMVAERGAGFCMIGGMTSFDAGKWQQTVWEKLVPVEMTTEGHGHKWIDTWTIFPAEVRKHPLLQLDADPEKNNRILDAHPKLLGFHDIRRAKPGATVLAIRKGSTAPLTAVQSYGKGRTMAYLSDPTGGWGVEFQGKWGPALVKGEPPPAAKPDAPGGTGPVSGEARALAPNEYYNRFWTNSVRWLAENSVRRWRKDLLGRTEGITYRPGDVVKVAATVPGVSDPEQMPNQVVGVRVALDAQPRVPLRYDRDRKEFVGEVRLPAAIAGQEAILLFDSPSGTEVRRDEVRVRILPIERELEHPEPDRELLAQIATVSSGAVLEKPADAADFLQRVPRFAAEDHRIYFEPIWNQGAVWAVLIGLLTVEWMLRRLIAP